MCLADRSSRAIRPTRPRFSGQGRRSQADRGSMGRESAHVLDIVAVALAGGAHEGGRMCFIFGTARRTASKRPVRSMPLRCAYATLLSCSGRFRDHARTSPPVTMALFWILDVLEFDRGGSAGHRRGRSTDGSTHPSAAPMVRNWKDPLRARWARVAHPGDGNWPGQGNRCRAVRPGYRPQRPSADRPAIRSRIRESPRPGSRRASDSRRDRFAGQVSDGRSGICDRNLADRRGCQRIGPRGACRKAGRRTSRLKPGVDEADDRDRVAQRSTDLPTCNSTLRWV
jgi:hypothetical protein